jgi:hypothetical protein
VVHAQRLTTYELTVDPANLQDSTVTLVGTDGRTVLVQNDDGNFGRQRSSSIVWTCDEEGNYFVAVAGFRKHTGQFRVAMARVQDNEACSHHGQQLSPTGSDSIDFTHTTSHSLASCRWNLHCKCGTPTITLNSAMPNLVQDEILRYWQDGDTSLEIFNGLSTNIPALVLDSHFDRILPLQINASGMTDMVIRYTGERPNHMFTAAVECVNQPRQSDRCLSCLPRSYGVNESGKLVCSPCPANAICLGGLAIAENPIECPVGSQPDVNGNACEACPIGKVNAGGDICVECEFTNQEPNENRTACRCREDYYDTARGSIICKHGDYTDTHSTSKATQKCMPCNTLSCIECSEHSVMILSGYATAQPLARAPAVARDVNIFQCPSDKLSIDSSAACRSTTISRGKLCAAGHDGPLCQVCVEGYAKSGRRCAQCSGKLGVAHSEVGLGIIAMVCVIIICVRYRSQRGRRSAHIDNNRLEEELNPVGVFDDENRVVNEKKKTSQKMQTYWTVMRAAVQPGAPS